MSKLKEKPSLEYYLNLQYPVNLYPDSEGGYVAQVKDLPGCLSQGETLEEAMANINEARELWIETVYEVILVGWAMLLVDSNPYF